MSNQTVVSTVLFVLLRASSAAAQPPGRPGESGPPPYMEPEQLIRQFDRDGDGKLSRQEAPERMRQRWAQIDTDGDGFATREELKARDARVGRVGGGFMQKPVVGPVMPSSPPGGLRGTASRFQPTAKFSVITIGTGSPRYDPERSGPSAAIQYQGRYVLVDMGNGTQGRLAQAGIIPRQIDALMLTHHHLDHNEEFSPLFINTRLMGAQPEIVGPPGTAKLVDFTGQFYAEDIAYRLRRIGRTMEDFGRATVREVRGGESLTVCGLKVTTAKVNHTIHTVAYRFEADGQSIVISGDLSYSESLIQLAKEADVLVMDAGAVVRRKAGTGVGGPPPFAKGPSADGSEDGLKAHSTAEEFITMVQKANVRRLVLTHIAPGEVDEEATRVGLAEAFRGEVIVGHDLLEVTPVAAAKSVGPISRLPDEPRPSKPAGTARVHVNATSTAPQPDGRTWATAFATVQQGIDAAAQQGGGEVWVAQGTYQPTTSTDRTASIKLQPGVAVYGGFVGTETRRDERNWEQKATIFSGDIGREGDPKDNSQHVVIGADDAILDGVTVAGGYAMDGGLGGPAGGPDGRGSGRRPDRLPGQPPIHIRPEMILAGPSQNAGAAMVNYQCAPTIRNCTFRDNTAGKGGAMYNMLARDFPPRPEAAVPTPLVVNCRFLNNYARGRGGAVANDLGTSPVFQKCTFIGNACDGKGGAMYDDFGCSPTLINCLFAENRSLSAGAIGNDGASSPRIIHCTFTRNVAQEEGAALYQGSGPANNPLVIGCILWGNRCDHGPAELFNWHDNEPQVSGSCVQGGYPGNGNFDKDPAFVDATKGDYGLRPDSPCRAIGHTVAAPVELLKHVAAQPVPGLGRRPGFDAKPRPAAPEGPTKRVCVNAANAQGPCDGTSWRTAFRTLTDALAAPAEGRVEVWVAAGTYLPTAGQERSASFVLRPGIELYGGFRGGETDRSQRDWRSNSTILSGDIGRPDDIADNLYHVVIGADHAVLDGFVIRDGNADGRTYDAKGGGLVNYQRGPQAGPMTAPVGFSPTVRNCLFTHNRAIEGGAVYNYDRGAPQFIGCRFVENAAEYGGAMVDRVGVRSTLSGCVFEDNTARWRAGALYLDYGARPSLTDCRFHGNRSDCHGGAIAAVSRASQLEATIPVFKNCAFVGNHAKKLGGAIADFDNSVFGLAQCTLSDNQAGQGGGAIALQSRARAVLLECQVSGNRSEHGHAEIAADETCAVSHAPADWPDQTAPSHPAGFGGKKARRSG